MLFSKLSIGPENFRTLLLETEAVITSGCDGWYGTVARLTELI